MTTITKIHVREILDSLGDPASETQVTSVLQGRDGLSFLDFAITVDA